MYRRISDENHARHYQPQMHFLIHQAFDRCIEPWSQSSWTNPLRENRIQGNRPWLQNILMCLSNAELSRAAGGRFWERLISSASLSNAEEQAMCESCCWAVRYSYNKALYLAGFTYILPRQLGTLLFITHLLRSLCGVDLSWEYEFTCRGIWFSVFCSILFLF